MTRYRRNHEIMNEVFIHAAFGELIVTYSRLAALIFPKESSWMLDQRLLVTPSSNLTT